MSRTSAVKIKIIFTVLILLVLSFPLAASAQMAIARIQITEIDYSQFPELVVNALVHDGNGDPIPASDLDNLELLEDGIVIEAVYDEITTGIEVLFVLDIGQGILRIDNGVTRLEQMGRVLRDYASNMKSGDTAAMG